MIGYDLLGLGSRYWPMKLTLQALPKDIAIGCLDTTFGEKTIVNLIRIIHSGKCFAVRIHLYYSAAHVLCPLSILRARLPIYERLAKKYHEVKFYVSHTCEYNSINDLEIKNRVGLIRSLAPTCVPVNSRWRGKRTPGVIAEIHTACAAATEEQILSTDGFDCLTGCGVEFLRKGADAKIQFLWTSSFNLKLTADEKAPAPRERKRGPTKKTFDDLAALAAV